MKATAVFLAGINNSGPGHWQRIWHGRPAGGVWVEHADWDWPSARTWTSDLERDLGRAPAPRVAVAHSLGCLLLGQWAAARPGGLRGSFAAAFLVAPPDVASPEFPDGLGFGPGRSHGALGVPGLVLASRNDPYGSLEHAQACAEAWGCGLVDVGARGHINADSGLGAWPEGWGHLEGLLRAQSLEL